MADSIRGPGHLADVVAVDRSSPVPLYYQVAQALQGAIEAGRLAPGLRLDNEIQLADDLGLSRPTMRRAMEYLVGKGLITPRPRLRTTIVTPKGRRPPQLSSLYDDLTTGGQEPTTRVLSLDVVPAPPEVAEALAVPPGSPVHRLVRRRGAGDNPIARMTNHLPTTLPGLGPGELAVADLEATGLYRLLRSAGVHL